MPDSDDPLAFLARPVTPQLVDSARRHLMMLRSLHEDVRLTVPTLCPPGTGAWRSTAADRYLERLEELRSLLIRALACLAEAEIALEERTRRLQSDLDAQPVVGTGWR
ncbi:hypothetical protein [Agromyces sp. NPDC049794]|uniref:hypothetical protein n=1 Tax=unclassified Agromyces TaxID=2639701 RepID=UPI0033E24C5B